MQHHSGRSDADRDLTRAQRSARASSVIHCSKNSRSGDVDVAEGEIAVAVPRQEPKHVEERADVETAADLACQVKQLRLEERSGQYAHTLTKSHAVARSKIDDVAAASSPSANVGQRFSQSPVAQIRIPGQVRRPGPRVRPRAVGKRCCCPALGSPPSHARWLPRRADPERPISPASGRVAKFKSCVARRQALGRQRRSPSQQKRAADRAAEERLCVAV